MFLVQEGRAARWPLGPSATGLPFPLARKMPLPSEPRTDRPMPVALSSGDYREGRFGLGALCRAGAAGEGPGPAEPQGGV